MLRAESNLRTTYQRMWYDGYPNSAILLLNRQLIVNQTIVIVYFFGWRQFGVLFFRRPPDLLPDCEPSFLSRVFVMLVCTIGDVIKSSMNADETHPIT